MDGGGTRPAGVVIAWPPEGSRPQRARPPVEGRRGEILLFMGVRYERLQEPHPEPQDSAADAAPRVRRKS